MPSTFVPHHLVHAHLPAPPSIPNSIPELRLPTEREYPPTDEDYAEPLHPDHAVSVYYDPSTNILARGIHNFYVLELRSFSPTISASRPRGIDGSETIRIFFPEPLRPLASGSIVVSRRDKRLFILVLSETNIVYRLNFALGTFRTGSGDRFVFTTKGNEDWSEEYEVPDDVIAACGGVGAWTVLDEDTVVLGGGDGGIVKLTRSGHWPSDAGRWTATHHRASSRLRLPSLFSRSANSDEQIISFAEFRKEDHIPVLYTLSRDRKLRTWNSATGSCLKTVDVRTSSQELVVRGSQEASGSSSVEDGSVSMIRVIPHPSTSSRFSHLVIVFFATPHNASSAGSFVVYRAPTTSHNVGDLIPAGEKACSTSSSGSELRGFDILPPVKLEDVDNGWRLSTTWDKDGSTYCETVFMDDLFQFTTYLGSHDFALLTDWQPVASPSNVDQFDAAYFDNILSFEAPNPADPADNGDIAAAFIQHLFHPGRFSTLTLATALDEYSQQISRRSRGAQISSSFASLSKRFGDIIGSQIEMRTNPQTGAPEVEVYRKDLKLEWLGVWATVRELDKQSRWPISTTVIHDHLFILTRDGISVPTPEDTAGLIDRIGESDINAEAFLDLPEGALRRVYPALGGPQARSSAIAISKSGAYVANALGRQDAEEGTGTILEGFVAQVNDQLTRGMQEPPEIIAGGLFDEFVDPYISEEDRTKIRRLLSESSSTNRALNQSLDILEDVTFPLGSSGAGETSFSGSGNALVASTIAQIIESRYQFARNVLLISLFHLSESRDPSDEDDEAEELIEILARTLTVYHRYRVLKWVCDQTGEEARERNKSRRTNKRKVNGGDDTLAEGLGSLRMREGDEDSGIDSDAFDVGYSLLHSLLARQQSQSVPESSISPFLEAALAFLTGLNILSPGQTDTGAQEVDVKLSYTILVDGHASLAGEYTDLYPLSAGLAYVKGRAYLENGAVAEALQYLEKAAAGCKDGSLVPILSSTAGPYGLGDYYRHVCRIFDEQGADAPVVHFGQLAIQNSPSDSPSSRDLWTRVFLASIALANYEDAYSTLTNLPFIDLKRDFLGQLISVMCENNEVGRLNTLGFIGFQKDVEEMLRFKARNSDPLRFPNYYKVLYSWHLTRGDYRSAGEIMYLQGRRFAEGSSSKVPAFELSAMQARSYLAAINALSLVDKRNAWVSVPGAPSKALRGIKRRKVSSFIPEEEFAKEKRPVDIVSLADIEMEYTLVLSQLRLSSHIPDLHEHGVSVSPQEVVGLFIQRGMFDIAQTAASSLHVDMTDLFQNLASKCVELSRLPERANDFSSAAFLQTSPVTSRLRGPPAALAMRYLQSALARHDSAKTNWRYRQAVADTLFEMNTDKKRGWQMPVWLAQWEMDRDAEGWISRALRWGWVAEALDWSLDLLRQATPPELLPKGKADVTNMPYNLFDRVLAAAQEGDEKDEKAVHNKAKALREEVERRVKGLKGL
ncbi:hypothetical protein CI109_102827 [Kwoniella shandongensis]|uniref:Uncharacterized protein n=1 Tax=Kwoniella shandongensis TaxID=1734106 RepID=A0A5M6C987_9TREE|nr:uncharacterized protein CI109_000018 [Kwoniella shandongensis]KAA5531180.1 hypothetical protein CI109_000018 [Kwoniella shandongensis]